MQEDEGREGPRQRRPASAATLGLLRELEARFCALIADLDMLGLSLAAARTDHALDAFRKEAERIAPH